ncbi:MAG: carboxypeptidase regulatory-like domain-containing protein [Ferruginibacter sp.]
MHFKKIIPFLIAIMSLPFAMNAQVTTSSISGIAKTASGSPLPGATITATHIPTGTVYTSVARAGGRFDINNMNPGGPYRITTTFTGFDSGVKEDIFLTLGETLRTDFDMQNKTTDLAAVVVAGRRTTTAKIGTETSISRAKLDILPTIGRNIGDYLRFTPQAKVNGQSISIGGQNNRFNSFLIDGAVNNDVFGLSTSGTNGGRASTPPISIDALEQLVVQVAPYDAALGNFTGGNINAITKSGSNVFHGSAYYVFRNEKLAGKTPGVVDSLRKNYPDFKNQTYGFTIGGPIVKNKVFFFLNAEKQKDNRPQPYTGPEGAVIDSITKLVNHLKTKYNYDPGDFRNNADLIDRININSRFDVNISNKHKLTLSYRYTDAERVNPSRSSYNGSSGTINFTNNAEVFPSISHSGNIELNSKFSNTMNNKFRISITDVVDDRRIAGNPFPAVFIGSFNGGPSFNFGSEAPSTANLLEQRILNFYDAFKYYTGKHAFTLGADIDLNKSYNLFINRNFGSYTYSTLGPNQPNAGGVPQIGGLQAFIEDRGPTRLQRSYSLVDGGNKTGDEGGAKAGARFNSVRLGFFLNDDIKVNDKFTLTLGLRADRTQFTTQPPTDPFFRDTARAVISQHYDLDGAQSGQRFKPSFLFSPRLGFKYVMDDENVTIRGGLGIFGGRTPLVWPGGIYQNTGTVIGALDTARTSSQLLNAGVGTNAPFGLQTVVGGVAQPVLFNPNVNTQPTQADYGLPVNLLASQGDISLVSRNFKLPTVFKTSLAADKRFGNGWTFTTELLFTKNIHEVDWKNVNIVPPTGLKSTGPDSREIYPTNGAQRLTYRPTGATGLIRNPYTSIILVRNTTGPRGYSYNFTVQLNKETKTGFSLNAAYTYGNSQVYNEGTSSVNESNWRFIETVKGRNFNVRSTSDFDLGHRIYALASKKFTYANKHAATTLTLSYNGQSGNPFSYAYSSFSSLNGIVGDGVNGNDLMYIPASRAEMDQMVFVTRLSGAAATPAANAANIQQQKDDYEAFILNDKYLSRRRGQFAERNGARLPFTNILDANIAQDFMVKVGQNTHKLSVILDIFNLTNLIDKDAGRIYFLSNDQASVVSFRGYQTGTTIPTFQFFKPNNNRANTSARWNGQLTFRYSF